MIGRKEGNSRILTSQTKFRLALGVFAFFAVFSASALAFFLAEPVQVEAIIPPEPPAQFASPPPPSRPEPPAVGFPVRVQIPGIGVDAPIVAVGLTPDGAMDVPKDPLDAAWYELGPRPGEAGSAVIAGHVDWFDGEAGVFKGLRAAKPGDGIRVQDHAGVFHDFVIREARIYDAEADATEIFLSSDGKAHLNLITCEGAWDRVAKRYAERLVLFADEAK